MLRSKGTTLDAVFGLGRHGDRLDVRYAVLPVWPNRRATRSNLTEGLRVGVREDPGVEGVKTLGLEETKSREEQTKK